MGVGIGSRRGSRGGGGTSYLPQMDLDLDLHGDLDVDVHVSEQGAAGVGAGLQNQGNTCYVNAALQCLTHTRPLAWALQWRRRWQQQQQQPEQQQHCAGCCPEHPSCALCALQAHLARALLQPRQVLRPPRALLRGFHRQQQEDAHEYLLYVLDALTHACGQAAPAQAPGPAHIHKPLHSTSCEDSGLVPSIFGGLWRSQIRCLHCHSVSETFEPYLDIALNIHAASSVEQALRELVKPECLDGDNAYECGHCQHKRAASKTLSLHSPSQVLVLALQRFCPWSHSKDAKAVAYPQELDLREYTSKPKGPPLLYGLYAILVHVGCTPHSGHYLAYVQSAQGLWYQMDDARVTACHVASALSQQAYVLFYLRKTQLPQQQQQQQQQKQQQNDDEEEEFRASCHAAPEPACPVLPSAQPGLQTSPNEPQRDQRLPRLQPSPQEPCQPTPPAQMTLDQWRAHQEHKRPTTHLQLRTVPGDLPAQAVLIHPSTGGKAWARPHSPSSKENTAPSAEPTNTASATTTAPATTRATKRRNKKTHKKMLLTLHSPQPCHAYRC
ncbi:ubiquitin carboxyl-terminal hydrolase 17-like protein 6 [Erinaceus europaeus]|uniref:Ubiquitin carboxyl-terminal hydrolase n=1 Tax=Erinaceus europaeus TaxID=9365 RepID=A0ABM3XDG2_ERIEU|nr:ubiquitin carboxyl-terminal hydrolase 17-like protein 6 [Erinaceus europaeus]